jgi:hypothetical protein
MPDVTMTVRGAPEQVAETMSAAASTPRLLVLAYLGQSTDGTAALDELTEYVATLEGRPGGSTLNQVRLRLYHVSLPTLAAADIVEFDTDTGRVEYSGPPSLSEQAVPAEFVVRPEEV